MGESSLGCQNIHNLDICPLISKATMAIHHKDEMFKTYPSVHCWHGRHAGRGKSGHHASMIRAGETSKKDTGSLIPIHCLEI